MCVQDTFVCVHEACVCVQEIFLHAGDICAYTSHLCVHEIFVRTRDICVWHMTRSFKSIAIHHEPPGVASCSVATIDLLQRCNYRLAASCSVATRLEASCSVATELATWRMICATALQLSTGSFQDAALEAPNR